jgi:hypothetical protein
MPTQSNEFTQVYVGDETNALIELGEDLKSATFPEEAAEATMTGFAPGGGRVTEDKRRGALQATVSLEVYINAAMWDLANRIAFARGGSTLRGLFGNNALPTYGDPLYQGTFTLFTITINYNVGAEATMTWEFKPTDGGPLVPKWDKV